MRQESERVERLEQAIRDAVPEWSLAEVVTALQAMRGIDLVAAVSVLAEIGDLSRFQTPRELMGYLGLVPCESSTGEADVHINATYRPAERAYLMHYAWRIAVGGLDPGDVPVGQMPVRICWVHRDANGNFDIGASKNAAREMVGGPGCPVFPGPHKGYCMKDEAVFDFDATMAQVISGRPQRNVTQHFSSLAIDMTISWGPGDLTITNGDGKQVTISTTPQDGNNSDLGKVGATYNVFKVQQLSDPGHWSANGH